jgi:hypothetical protein
MMMKNKFRIQKSCQVFDGVSTSYAFIIQFVIIINDISCPCKGDDSSFISVSFHTVSSTPTANGIDVTL